MLRRSCILLTITLLGAISIWAQDKGFVAKPAEGERLLNGGVFIKASPRTGSQGAEMIWSALPPGGSAGLHVHHRADEFFYVISGVGVASVGGKDVPIEAGDVVFVPKGQEHKLKNSSGTDPLKTIFLLDRPGLANEFRDVHTQSGAGKRSLTLDELNRISQKYGTTYKTVAW
jgi:mannose-6-phosphate isomerase-like protein (cupin superfamily)